MILIMIKFFIFFKKKNFFIESIIVVRLRQELKLKRRLRTKKERTKLQKLVLKKLTNKL